VPPETPSVKGGANDRRSHHNHRVPHRTRRPQPLPSHRHHRDRPDGRRCSARAHRRGAHRRRHPRPHRSVPDQAITRVGFPRRDPSRSGRQRQNGEPPGLDARQQRTGPPTTTTRMGHQPRPRPLRPIHRSRNSAHEPARPRPGLVAAVNPISRATRASFASCRPVPSRVGTSATVRSAEALPCRLRSRLRCGRCQQVTPHVAAY
jgi:hypothetical protein